MKYSPELNIVVTVFCGIIFFFALFTIPSFIWGWITETAWKPIMINWMSDPVNGLLAVVITIIFMVVMFLKNNGDI